MILITTWSQFISHPESILSTLRFHGMPWSTITRSQECRMASRQPHIEPHPLFRNSSSTQAISPLMRRQLKHRLEYRHKMDDSIILRCQWTQPLLLTSWANSHWIRNRNTQQMISVEKYRSTQKERRTDLQCIIEYTRTCLTRYPEGVTLYTPRIRKYLEQR